MAEKEKSEEDLLKEWDGVMSGGKGQTEKASENGEGAKNEQSNSSEDQNRGIKAVLEKALQSYEKLPMLEIVFERLVRLLTTALRNLTSESVEINIDSMDSLRFNGFINTVSVPTLISIFKAIEWENYGLMILDNNLIYSMVDILFGGKKSQTNVKSEGRAFTEIEQEMVKQISEVILNELGAAFDPISPSTFSYERIETNPYFVNICRPGDAIILLKLSVNLEDRGGKIDLVIPYATLEPIKSLLTQVFMGEKFGSDIEWEESLYSIAQGIEFPLEAVIMNKPVHLSKVAKLKVGHTIIMDHEAGQDIMIRSSNIDICKARIGKVKDKLACYVTQFVHKEKE